MPIFVWDEIAFEWAQTNEFPQREHDGYGGAGWTEFRPAGDVRVWRSSRGHFAIAVEAETMEAAHSRACDFPGYLDAVNG